MINTESARQRELDSFRIVDSMPEREYDDIARVAAALCGTPNAVVSLIDRDRQWFKARVGFEASETSRDEAICNHAIQNPQMLLEVKDAREDRRFAHMNAVRAVNGVRFYAGMPLVTTNGAAIGTVCVFDEHPRTLNNMQRDGLAALARLTMSMLNTRMKEHEASRAAVFAAPAERADENEESTAQDCVIALFEVQHLAQAASRLGQRATEREVAQLEQQMETILRPHAGASVGHVSGTGELTVLLYGAAAASCLSALRECSAAFTQRTGIEVRIGHADSAYPGEPMIDIYQRADEALTLAKNAPRAEQRAA